MSNHLVPEQVNPLQSSENSLRVLATALIAVGVHPRRAVFAEWMGIVRPERIRLYALLLYGLVVLNALLSSVVPAVFGLSHLQATNQAPTLPILLIVAIVLSPIAVLLSILVIVFIVAALMPASMGALNHRSYLLLCPFLLAWLAATTVDVILDLFTLPLQLPIVAQHLPVITWQPLVAFAYVIYEFILLTNALAAVSTRSRWLLLTIIVLGQILGYLLAFILPVTILGVFGIHMSL